MSSTSVQSHRPLVLSPGLHDPNDPNPASNSEDKKRGGFTDDAYIAEYVTEEYTTTAKDINKLKGVEQTLAAKYGLNTDPIDTVEVRDEAKVKAEDGSRESMTNFAQLHELYHLRMKYLKIKPPDPKLAPPPPIPSHCIDASKFWAVVIGIDGYPERLHGCVSDAAKMATFLRDGLRVPQNRIQYLVDSPQNHRSSGVNTYPSRANIMATLYGLIDNPDVHKDENLIIYFAGHGSFYSSEGGDIEVIEALCPIDRGSRDARGAPIQDICDREINTILSQISRTKGHKITVILDCCHAGGATRDASGGTPRIVTGIESTSLEEVLRIADEGLEARRFPGYKSIQSKEWIPDMGSHVVVAACGAFQTAMEVQGETEDATNGFFTMHLLAALRSGSVTDQTTYRTLLNQIPVSDTQTPVVAGRNVHSRLWYQ